MVKAPAQMPALASGARKLFVASRNSICLNSIWVADEFAQTIGNIWLHWPENSALKGPLNVKPTKPMTFCFQHVRVLGYYAGWLGRLSCLATPRLAQFSPLLLTLP